MGKISDDMQNVVDEICSSAQARGTALRETREKARQLMKDADNAVKDIHNVNQAQAKALREKLSFQEKARATATQEFMEEIKESIGEIKVEVSEIRSGTHNFTERLRMEHGDMAKALREKLSSQEKARAQATQEFMEEVHQTNNQGRDAVREMLGEIDSDLRQAGQIWTKGVRIATKVAAEEEKTKKKPEQEEIKKKPEEEKEKLLEVIASHPEGVKLIDIGNELGVDWRTLIGPTKSLVDEDEIEKIDTMYYPK